MNQNDLYDFAEKNNIIIDEFPLKKALSLAIMDEDSDCFIAINSKRIETASEKNERLMHEIGHCMTGSFYSRHTPLITRKKCEYRANKWAYENYIPFDKLKKAMQECCDSFEELADYFGVTAEFVYKAYTYYMEIKGLTFFENEN